MEVGWLRNSALGEDLSETHKLQPNDNAKHTYLTIIYLCDIEKSATLCYDQLDTHSVDDFHIWEAKHS